MKVLADIAAQVPVVFDFVFGHYVGLLEFGYVLGAFRLVVGEVFFAYGWRVTRFLNFVIK